MPAGEREFRAGIDRYLRKHPGKEGVSYEIPKVTPKQKRARRILVLIQGMIPVIMTAVLLYAVFLIGFVPSGSMYPALGKGDLLVGNRLAYRIRQPERGDIVVFKKNGAYLVKRVIGLPGERVTLDGGKVYIDGCLLDEPYLAEGTCTLPFTDGNALSEFPVPAESVFLLGDSRSISDDSRYWTDRYGNPAPYVFLKDITGRAVLSLSRKNGLRIFRGYSWTQGQTERREVETTDETAALLNPNADTQEYIVVSTLPVDTEDSYGPEDHSAEESSVQQTLPAAENAY